MSATREQIVAEARTWLDTRFKHQARIKGVGVDCLNLVIGVATTLSLVESNFRWENYPEYHGYGKSPNGKLLLSGCERFMDRIPVESIKPGDILIMRFVDEPQHFVIVTQTVPTPYILHAYAQVRMVKEHRMDDTWRSRVIAAYRFRNIIEG